VPNITQIIPPRVAIIDERTGAMTREWYRYFYNLYYAVGGTNGGAIPADRGGTGTTQAPTDGDILIGDSTTGNYIVAQISLGDGLDKTIGPGFLELFNTGVLSNIAGPGISLDSATGNVTITNAGVLSNIAGAGISVNSATGDVTIDNTGVLSTSAGTGISVSAATGDITVTNTGVLSVSAGSTGLTPSTGTSGDVVLSGVLNEVHGGTGQNEYDKGDLLYASAVDVLSRLPKPSVDAMLRMSGIGVPSWKVPRYGAFHDTINHTAAPNTPSVITLNSTDYSNGVSIGTPTSRIVMSTAGLYNIQFSIQFTNTSATLDDVIVWLRVNGTDVPNTASWGAVPTKHGSIDGSLIMALNLFYEFSSNDYFELVWMTIAGTTYITTIPGSTTPPVYPLSPSVILTVSDNIAA
jgi:hypothetical protein